MARRSVAPDGRSAAPDDRRRLLNISAAFAVVGAAAAGWHLAGPPGDATAPVPAQCPAVDPVAVPVRADQGAGVSDRLVPMPLPQPRGPVSVRVCAYAEHGSGYTLRTSAVVEPVRTAVLAGLLNRTPGPVVTDVARRAECTPGREVAVLVFRYTQGPGQQVDVLGGDCALVRTPARTERDRQDVVRAVNGVLARSGDDGDG